MKWNIILTISIISLSCSNCNSNVYSPIVYCGFAEGYYYEYWFYGDSLILYDYDMGGVFNDRYTLLKQDSIYFMWGNEMTYSFEIVKNNPDEIILKDVKDNLGIFLRIQVPYLYDAKKARDNYDSLSSGFRSEAFKRKTFLEDYFNNKDYIESLY